MNLALYIGVGLVLGVVLGLIVAYVSRPKNQESNAGGVIKAVGAILAL